MSRRRAGDAAAVIHRLFEELPANPGEVRHRLKGLNQAACRAALLEVLDRFELEGRSLNLFLDAGSQLQLWKEQRKLAAVAADRNRSRRVRAAAVGALARGGERAQEAQEALARALGPDELFELSDVPLEDSLGLCLTHRYGSYGVAEWLQMLPDEDARALFFQRLERCRQRVGAPAWATYESSLACAELGSLREGILEAALGEPEEETVSMLERLLAAEQDEEIKAELRAALLRTRTRLVDLDRPPLPLTGRAWVGAADGQGRFIAIVALDNPNGSLTVLDICAYVNEQTIRAFVFPQQSAAQLERLHAKLVADHMAMVEAPLAEAGELVREAARRTAPGLLSPAAEMALTLFARIPAGEGEDSEVAPARPELQAARELLQAEELMGAWFFEFGDLADAGILPPAGSGPDEKWYREALGKLATSPLRARAVAMARHMARWYRWKGDQARAATMAGLADEAERSFETCVLGRAMLEGSMRAAQAIAEKGFDAPVFRAATRVEVRRAYFRKEEKPRGRDLALLDFTAAALDALEAAFSVLPGSQRPEHEIFRGLSLVCAEVFLEDLEHKRNDLDRKMATLLGDVGFSREIGPAMNGALRKFAETCCAGTCTKRCLLKFNGGASAAFFDDRHPAGVD